MKIRRLTSLKNKVTDWLKRLNPNLVVAVSALVVSACALSLSIQEVWIMREQQRASMYPHITIGRTYNSEGYGVTITNSGNGLARIYSYQVNLDNIYFRDWFDVINTVMPEAQNINYNNISTFGDVRNQMIAPGEEKHLIFLRWTDESRILEKRVQNLKVSVSYSSLLGEHWQVIDGVPVEISGPAPISMDKEFDL